MTTNASTTMNQSELQTKTQTAPSASKHVAVARRGKTCNCSGKRGKICNRCTKSAGKVATDVKTKKTRVIHITLDLVLFLIGWDVIAVELFWFSPKFYFLVVLALACISLRTKVLIVLTALHAVVTMVSLFYFVAVRQLNKPTPEKPNAKILNSDENHVNWCLRMVKDLYCYSKKGVLLAQVGCGRSHLIPLQCRLKRKLQALVMK